MAKPTRTRQEVAPEITHETDPQKLMILVAELGEAFDQRDAARKPITPSEWFRSS
jgi:hypothetical protein